jgi:hypothetical protein
LDGVEKGHTYVTMACQRGGGGREDATDVIWMEFEHLAYYNGKIAENIGKSRDVSRSRTDFGLNGG